MKPENEGSFFKRTSIRYMIFVYFTVTALAASIFIGLSLYSRMSKQMSGGEPDPDRPAEPVCGCVAPRNHEAFGHHILRDRKKHGSEE